MSNNIVQFNEEIIKGQIKELVRGSVEETLNELLEAEAEKLTQAARYERSEARQGYRSGHYDRNLTTTSGDVTLHMPRLKGISFETAIIERYRRRESSVEEALIEMYLAGVSVRPWFPDASCSCISCSPTGFRLHDEAVRRPASAPSSRQEMLRPPLSCARSHGSSARLHCWFGSSPNAQRESHSTVADNLHGKAHPDTSHHRGDNTE